LPSIPMKSRSAVIALLVRVIDHQKQERYIRDDERKTERRSADMKPPTALSTPEQNCISRPGQNCITDGMAHHRWSLAAWMAEFVREGVVVLREE
jgi:hypothetical protein